MFEISLQALSNGFEDFMYCRDAVCPLEKTKEFLEGVGIGNTPREKSERDKVFLFVSFCLKAEQKRPLLESRTLGESFEKR